MCCIEWWKGSIFDALRTRWVNYKTIFSERRRLTWAPGASACARMIEPLTSLSSSHCSGFQCNGTIKVLGPLLPPQNPSVTHSGTMSCRGGQYPPVVKQCLRPSNTIHLQDCHSFEKKKESFEIHPSLLALELWFNEKAATWFSLVYFRQQKRVGLRKFMVNLDGAKKSDGF